MILVDSCVLIDIFTGDERWREWSERALAEAADDDKIAINAVIYAEVSLSFETIEALDDALSGIEVLPIPPAAAFLAARLHTTYRQAGGTKIRPLPDSFIGAHAAVMGYRLLTRNPGDFVNRLPRLSLIAP